MKIVTKHRVLIVRRATKWWNRLNPPADDFGAMVRLPNRFLHAETPMLPGLVRLCMCADVLTLVLFPFDSM